MKIFSECFSKDLKIVIERVFIDQKSPNVAKFTISFKTLSPNSSSVFNITYQLFEAIENVKVDIRFCFPESDHDNKYLREVFRSSVDLGKTLKSLKTNIFIQSILTRFLKSHNGTSEFPLPAGIYQFTNLRFDGSSLPPITSKYSVILKIFMKPLKKNGKFVLTNLVNAVAKLN